MEITYTLSNCFSQLVQCPPLSQCREPVKVISSKQKKTLDNYQNIKVMYVQGVQIKFCGIFVLSYLII